MRTTAILLALLASPAAAGEDPITIRGLSLDSTPAQLEEALETYGESDVLGYDLDEQGRAVLVHLPCDFVRGCDYSRDDLMGLLVKGLSLSGEPVHAQFSSYVDGPAGDRLFVSEFEDTLIVQIVEYNYRKPALLLD